MQVMGGAGTDIAIIAIKHSGSMCFANQVMLYLRQQTILQATMIPNLQT